MYYTVLSTKSLLSIHHHMSYISYIVLPTTLQGWSSFPIRKRDLRLKETRLPRVTKKGSRAEIGSPRLGPLPLGQDASHTQTAACCFRRRWNDPPSHSVFLDAEFWFHFQVTTQASSKLPVSLP